MNTAKDMRKVYESTSTKDLIANKHKKIRALERINGFNTYWAKKDRARLTELVEQIDAELNYRAAQTPLF